MGRDKMSEVKEVCAPALVYCNCTKILDSNKAAESNFEIYRYLKIDPEGERNIFCKDQPFLFSDDWKPYINIDPFPFCQSAYYETAVKSLMDYTQDMLWEATREKKSESEILLLGEELNNLNRAYDYCRDQALMRNKTYICILQVVDHWFEVSKKMKVSNYFSWSQKAQTTLERVNRAYGQVVLKAKQKLRKAQPNVWQRMGEAFSELHIQIEDLTIYKDGTFSISYKGFKRFDKTWNTKDTLAWFDDRMNELKGVLSAYTEIIHEELFFAKSDGYINNSLAEAKKLFLNFYEAIKDLEYEDDIGFEEDLEELKSSLDDLAPDLSQFSNMKKEYLNKNSFLVCRCGGIIRIVYDGQDLKNSLDIVYKNLIDFLKWIENHLHQYLFNTAWGEWEMPVSFVDGFNFVRLFLLLIEEGSQYNDFYRMTFRGKEQEGFGVEMKITIQPRSVINKKEHNKSGAFNLLGAFLGGFSNVFENSAMVSVGASAFMEIIAPSNDNAASLSVGVGSLVLDDGAKKVAADILGNLLIIKSLASAVADFRYESTADYVGQIKVDLSIGTHDITYIRNYDIEGKIYEDTNVKIERRMKPVAGIDPSRTAIVNGMVRDIRNFDNTLKVDTTLIIDAEKVREIKEYNLNERGLNET